MNTEQKYVGRGDSANTPPSAAQNAAQTSPPPDDRRPYLIKSDKLLAFNRTPGKVQILHINLWYADGSTDQINVTSPHVSLGEDIERQYIYMKMYLQKSARDLSITAYQASLCYANPDGTFKKVGTYAKVDCATIMTFKPGQYCEHE